MWTRLLVPAALCLPLLLSTTASAGDNPAVAACSGKSKGDACTFKKPHKQGNDPMTEVDQSGTCQEDECCELDYSKGSPPVSNCSTCLACKDGGGGEQSGRPVPSPADPRSPAGDGEPPRAGDEPPASPGNGKGGCAVATPGNGSGAPAMLALLLPLLLRRRA